MDQKETVIQILFDSFYENNSTVHVVKQDQKKDKRLKLLLEYSWFMSQKFGEVMLNEDGTACALLLYPNTKKTTFSVACWNLRLAISSIGLKNLGYVLKREKAINSMHPKGNFIYGWYLGVNPNEQGKGNGTQIMKSLIEKSEKSGLPIILETSSEKNYRFYEGFGFRVIGDLSDLGYGLKTFAYNLKD